ncbi:hypothetical protein HDU76_006083 [Blyttiomyces sp. JEL0837]|nr:hypothetical protein HDU76_006083 [Blyttiomyces sp. JEL0837]
MTIAPVSEYEAAKAEILALVEEKGCHPILLRLAWHDAGTYDAETKTGGPNASMRFAPVSLHGANNGLAIARDLLAPIGAKHPQISTADLWALGGVVAIEYGARGTGLKLKFRAGRKDVAEGVYTPDGRLPDASKGSDHLRNIFHRMGLNDQDIVALSGAHSLGRLHSDRSGFDGPWVEDPTRFSNAYFIDILKGHWEVGVSTKGQPQFFDKSKGTAMLATDLALMADPIFRGYVDKYAASQEAFFADFAVSFQKLLELGCEDLVEVLPPTLKPEDPDLTWEVCDRAHLDHGHSHGGHGGSKVAGEGAGIITGKKSDEMVSTPTTIGRTRGGLDGIISPISPGGGIRGRNDAVDLLAIIRNRDKKVGDKIVLVVQYRPPVQGYVVEFPAGLVDPGEDVEVAALRELKEETGFVGKVVSILNPSPYEPGLTSSCGRLIRIEIDGTHPSNINPQPSLDKDEWSLKSFTTPISTFAEDIDTVMTELKSQGKEDTVMFDSRVTAFAEALREAKNLYFGGGGGGGGQNEVDSDVGTEVRGLKLEDAIPKRLLMDRDNWE